VREPVRGEAVDNAVGVAELVIEARTNDSLRQSVADVATFLRTWYQMSGTLAGGVESFSWTKIVALPAVVKLFR